MRDKLLEYLFLGTTAVMIEELQQTGGSEKKRISKKKNRQVRESILGDNNEFFNGLIESYESELGNKDKLVRLANNKNKDITTLNEENNRLKSEYSDLVKRYRKLLK
jgi:hypothetical protein